ncbi:aldo/keto reductase [Amycolatopsis sp. NPDC059090]|uniref:aldo/keto reductase n=1 Tax=unclassified Amycolatopsis TaxID=2618356 RepID=UPI00366DF21B
MSGSEFPVALDTLYTRLGRTGLMVAKLGLGTVNFGGRVDGADTERLLDHALAQGINLLDTANIYGWRVHKGYTEETLGRWLARDPARRERVILATKAGKPMGTDPNDGGLSARHLIASCEASLRRLRTDWIDLFQLHHVDRMLSWDEIWQALDLLVRQGKVRYVGSSNFAGWDIASAQEAALRRNSLGLVAEQCLYNLFTRHAELEVIPAARAYGLGVVVWSPLHGGLLGGVVRKMRENDAVKSAQGRALAALATHRDTIAAFENLCVDFGHDPAQVALSWLVHRPGITTVLIGPRTARHVDDALAGARLSLSDSESAALETLFPPVGRGGAAPDAWLS